MPPPPPPPPPLPAMVKKPPSGPGSRAPPPPSRSQTTKLSNSLPNVSPKVHLPPVVPPPTKMGGVPPPPPVNMGGVPPPPPIKMGGVPPPPPIKMGGVPPPPPIKMGGVPPPPPVKMGGVPPPPPVKMGGVPPSPPVRMDGAPLSPPVKMGGIPPPPPPKRKISNHETSQHEWHPSMRGGVPPPPPNRSSATHLTSVASPPQQVTPPPVPKHSPDRKSHAITTPPPPPPHRLSSHGIIPQSNTSPPLPRPKRLSNSPDTSDAPPPPPVRRGSKKSLSSTPPQSPLVRGGGVPPPHRNEGTAISTLLEKNESIPPPPQLQGQSTSNGLGDYDVPRPSKQINGRGDYDVPLTQKEREARERASRVGVSSTPGGSSPPGGLGDMDHENPLLKEEKMRREKVVSMLATRSKRMSDTSSDGSRPLSNASSVYSADASSVSLNSNNSGSKVAIPPGEENCLISESSIDEQLELIDQLVEDAAAQNTSKMRKSTPSTSEHLLGGSGQHLRSLSGSLLDEDGSSGSNTGSNDNLGVWDDISSEEDSDEVESASKDSGKDEVLLESWIKELEQGIQGMSNLAGVQSTNITTPPTPPPPSVPTIPIIDFPKESIPTPTTIPPPPPPTVPLPPPPTVPLPPPPTVPLLPPPIDVTPGPTAGIPIPPQVARPPPSKEAPARKRLRSRTEKEMSRVATWRLSMRAMEDAEDPDLDALLEDLCKLEEDTKAQLATSNTHGAERADSIVPMSPTDFMKKDAKGKGGTSSDDFIQFMEGLQSSRNIVADPSRAVSMATYTDSVYMKGQSKGSKQLPPDISHLSADLNSVNEDDPGDIFSRESLIMRSNSITRSSSLSKSSNSNFQKSKKPRDIDTNTALAGTEKISSPSHEAIQKQLNDFAEQLTIDESLTPEQQILKLKNEKLKIAMMKLKEASVQKMVLKVYNIDGSTKMVAIHETMNARDVCILLAERNHQQMGPNWTLVERLSELHLERTLEDHEKVLECINHWPRSHNNSILFKNNPEKYYIIKRPQLLMPSSHAYSSVNPQRSAFSERQKRNIILKELFQNKILPTLEGELHIREGKKSGWKKHTFVLRASGLYYSKSGKSLSSKDIVRVVEWKDVECYSGNQYKKFYRAPGNYCFSLVPNGPVKKVEKAIVHICVPTKHDLLAWMTGIRLAKYGTKLEDDYNEMKAEMPWLQLEDDDLESDIPSTPRKSVQSVDAELTTIMVNGKEVSPQELAKKGRITSLRGSFHYKGDAGLDKDVHAPTESHVITGPLGQTPNINIRKKRNPSVLEAAFQNAWKQGNLAAEMSGDTEKWPIFDQPPSKTAKKKGSSHESLTNKGSLPYVMEDAENNGMFTLRKNKEKQEMKKRQQLHQMQQSQPQQSAPPPPLSQSAPPPPIQQSAPPPPPPLQSAPPPPPPMQSAPPPPPPLQSAPPPPPPMQSVEPSTRSVPPPPPRLDSLPQPNGRVVPPRTDSLGQAPNQMLEQQRHSQTNVQTMY